MSTVYMSVLNFRVKSWGMVVEPDGIAAAYSCSEHRKKLDSLCPTTSDPLTAVVATDIVS